MTAINKFLRTPFAGTAAYVGACNIELDFTKQSVTSSDLVNICTIPKGTIVIKVAARVETGEGSSITSTFGDSGGVATWMATGPNLQTADNHAVSLVGDTNAGCKYYVADDTLTLSVSGTVSAAKLYVTVLYAREPHYT